MQERFSEPPIARSAVQFFSAFIKTGSRDTKRFHARTPHGEQSFPFRLVKSEISATDLTHRCARNKRQPPCRTQVQLISITRSDKSHRSVRYFIHSVARLLRGLYIRSSGKELCKLIKGFRESPKLCTRSRRQQIWHNISS